MPAAALRFLFALGEDGKKWATPRWRERASVPAPFFVGLSAPLIAPAKVKSSERSTTSDALFVTGPRIDPDVPPLPIWSVPPSMVVPSV